MDISDKLYSYIKSLKGINVDIRKPYLFILMRWNVHMYSLNSFFPALCSEPYFLVSVIPLTVCFILEGYTNFCLPANKAENNVYRCSLGSRYVLSIAKSQDSCVSLCSQWYNHNCVYLTPVIQKMQMFMFVYNTDTWTWGMERYS